MDEPNPNGLGRYRIVIKKKKKKKLPSILSRENALCCVASQLFYKMKRRLKKPNFKPE